MLQMMVGVLCVFELEDGHHPWIYIARKSSASSQCKEESIASPTILRAQVKSSQVNVYTKRHGLFFSLFCPLN